MLGILYLVGTPIGNLEDISPRCARILGQVDFIAAEDTRVSLRLLNHLDIKKPLVSYHEHNKQHSGEKIVRRLLAGESCALVSDAGMPAISDPGQELVALCDEQGIEVLVIPGPSALISALALSGLPAGRFTFEGFLTTNKKNRRQHLSELKSESRAMVFYEAPHKLKHTLSDLLDALGDRRVSISRELTKLHEETERTSLSGALVKYEDLSPRGEFVLVVEGAQSESDDVPGLDEGVELVRRLVSEGMSFKDAVKEAAARLSIPKNSLYEAAK